MSRTKRVLDGFSWTLVNNFSLFIQGFVISAIIARALKPSVFGEYSYLIWLFTVISLIGILGANQTVVKYVAEWQVKSKLGQAAALVRAYLGLQLAFFVILAGLLWLIAAKFSGVLGRSIPLSLIFIVLAITLPSVINASLLAALQGLQRFRSIAMANIVSIICSGLLVVIALVTNPNLVVFLFILLVVQAVLMITYGYFLKDFICMAGILPKDELRKIFHFALGIYLIAFIDLVVWQRSEVYFLGRFSSNREVAFYSLAFSLITSSIFLVISAFNTVLMPMFTKLFHEDDTAIAAGYYRTTKLAGLFVIPSAAGLAMIAPALIDVLYGSAYASLTNVMRILTVGVAVSAIAGAGSALVYAQGKHWFTVKIGIPLAAINIGLDLWLIPHYAAVGAAWANVTTQVLAIIAGTMYVLTTFKVKAPFGALAKILVASLVMVAVLGGLQLFHFSSIIYLLMAVPAGVVVYFMTLLSIRVLDATDIKMLQSVENSLPARTAKVAHACIQVLERYSL